MSSRFWSKIELDAKQKSCGCKLKPLVETKRRIWESVIFCPQHDRIKPKWYTPIMITLKTEVTND